MIINQLRCVPTFCKARPLAFLLFAMMAVFIYPASAQSNYTIRKADLPAPFKYSEIREMSSDNDGYIWFTTSQGLWRFDGTDVQPFDMHDPRVPQSAVPDVVYRYRGYVLLFFDAPRASHMFAYNIADKKLTAFTIDNHPVCFSLTAAGSLSFFSMRGQRWLFSAAGKLSRAENLRDRPEWSPPARFENILRDNDGSLYIFCFDKIARLANKHLTVFNRPPNDSTVRLFHFNYTNSMLSTSAYLLARFSIGFIIYDKATMKPVYSYHGSDNFFVITRNDRLVVLAGPSAGIKPRKDLFDLQQMDISGVIGSIKTYLTDPATGNVVVGGTKGMFVLEPNVAGRDETDIQKATAAFFHDKSVRSIYRLKDGKMYLGTYSGTFVVDKNKIRLLAPLVVYCIYPYDDHTLLLGIEGGTGFATLDTRTDKIATFKNGGRYIYGFCLAKYAGSMIGGTTMELFRLSNTAKGDWDINLLLRCDTLGNTRQILPLNNRLWIAAANGLFKWTPGGPLEKVFPKKEKYAVYSVLPDGDNFWLGTAAHGLIKIDRKGNILQQIKFADGLAGDFVYSLYKTNGLLFAGTNEGLSVFDMNARMQSIDAPDDPQYSEELNHSAIFYDEGRQQLIFGGVHGLLFPDMQHYRSALEHNADRVRLSYVKKGENGREQSETDLFAGEGKTITLEPGYGFLGLKFSGSNIWRQRSFLFRIPGLDTAWRRSNLNTEISFYGLAPGKYTLQARFPSVVGPAGWLTKTIIVVPHFYQTSLFKFLLGLVLALIIYMAWLARVKKIRDEHLLRTTIASDLHDEIGSALTRISLSSELMNIKQEMDPTAVDKISTDSKGAIASISDIIWSVDARNDTMDDLILRMKEHAHHMLDDIAVMHFDVHGLDKVTILPQLVRQNCYLIFKEAINNIARHNTNPSVWITLNNQLSGMTITIKNTTDAGKVRSVYTGQGLRNMQMRAQRIKAALETNNGNDFFSVTIRMKRW